MNKSDLTSISRSAATLAAILLSCGGAANAQSTSPWNEHPNSKVRLIAGEGRMLGVELQLAPGWKTYWRMPGDAGVPPSFDWAGSQNLGRADVLYPAPATMKDAAGVAVGYTGTVIFPVNVKLEQEGKPAAFVLEFAFGVCKDICIPVESKLAIVLDGAAPWAASAPLKAHLARVPIVAAEPSKAGPLIATISQDAPAGKARLIVATANASDVYVEAQDGLFVPLSKNAGGGRFEFDLSSSPDLKDLIGKPLRITAATTAGGVETSYVLK